MKTKLDGIPIWVLVISAILTVSTTNSESLEVRTSLVQFISTLSKGTFPPHPSWGWNTTSDPCLSNWTGISCDSQGFQVKRITLEDLNLSGFLDPSSLCTAPALAVLSLIRNSINGVLSDQIGDCRRLTHLYLTGNRFSGPVPATVSNLSNLKRFQISNNSFSGPLPDLTRVSGLVSFLVEDNQFSGTVPAGFDFSNLETFNVSNNELSGPVPDNLDGRFGINSFLGNAELCGQPLPNACPEPPPSPSRNDNKTSSSRSRDQILIYSGYILLALVVVVFILVKLLFRKNRTEVKDEGGIRDRTTTPRQSVSKPRGSSSSDDKTVSNSRQVSEMRSEYSITSADHSGAASASFVLLSSPLVKGLKFNDLLKAPAELLGKGKHGSVYKVVLDNGMAIAVKRAKDNWGISGEDFSRRINKIDKVKHPRVLPPLAFYCSDSEKLLVYECQPNASLFMLIHGAHNGRVLDWASRLVTASCVAEALAFMHRELQEDGIAHGNLKSANILFNKDLEPCISEYGLTLAETPDQSQAGSSRQRYSPFKVDVYAFGVLLLEMLTGKLVQNNGNDLAKWVHSAVREEWTVEVFDKALIAEGANEERMVNMLQVALKCITPSPHDRPSMDKVVEMLHAIREEEDRSTMSEA